MVFSFFPVRAEVSSPPCPSATIKGEKMITGALNTISVELVFLLTLGDQIDKTVQQLREKNNQMTGTPPGAVSLVQQESIMILQNLT